MANYGHIIFYSLIGGLLSLIGGLLLLRSKKSAEKLAIYATPFVAGALLAAVFLDLLIEGLEVTKPDVVLLAALSGILVFFLAERFFALVPSPSSARGERPISESNSGW